MHSFSKNPYNLGESSHYREDLGFAKESNNQLASKSFQVRK